MISRLIAIMAISVGLLPAMAMAEPPRRALQYRADVIRYSRLVFGLDAPVAMFAGQIHQESAWDYLARSPYAAGLTQFTPATADWVAQRWPALAQADVYNPRWAIHAMLIYNQWLYGRITAASDCDRWAKALAGYNGGPGWITRDEFLAAEVGLDPLRWWDNVERVSSRAAWAFRENRHYPKTIIDRHQPVYLRWGTHHVCAERVKDGPGRALGVVEAGSGDSRPRVSGLAAPLKRAPASQD